MAPKKPTKPAKSKAKAKPTTKRKPPAKPRAKAKPKPRAKAVEPKIMGRPTIRTKKLVDTICERIALGESLATICMDEGMPHKSQVFRWCADDADFRDRYAHAREFQTEGMIDEIVDIADDGTNDWMERKDKDGKNIGWRENGEALRRSTLRVDTRFKIAEKLLPKKYGPKAEIDINLNVSTLTDDDLNAKILELAAKLGMNSNGVDEG